MKKDKKKLRATTMKKKSIVLEEPEGPSEMVFKSTHKRFLNKVFEQDGFQYVILHEPPPEPVITP
jgi:hypothetical protein